MKKQTKNLIKIFSIGVIFLIGIVGYIGEIPQFFNFTSSLSFLPDSFVQLTTTHYYLEGEDTLRLAQFVLSHEQAEIERKLFRERISGIDTTSRESAGEVDSISLYKLYGYASNLHHLFEANEKFVTMLKIYMGRDMETGKALLIYQPMYFIQNESLVNNKIKYVPGNFNNLRIYFTCRQKKLEQITEENAEIFIKNYKKHIKIKNGQFDLFRGFNRTTDDIKDVEAVLFSFQEIFALMRDNPKPDNSVFILNVAYGPTHSDESYYIKHSLLLSSKITLLSKPQIRALYPGLYHIPNGQKDSPAPMEGKCGNLGNRCPPGDVAYQVE